ncbi:U1 small nuclear ribonucleoprotein 70 kDa [Senna tora]|uniref:U1 small nuclear ribonucleoprotein 70 kDa n=1 Tax=Senna tora TaxID=362788 RepID=A0A834U2M5_9FABA|nr:U1 small nuclear ribonucleoprotein 70 kDa [Senna tora]
MGDHNDAFMRNQNAAVQARTKAQNRSNVLQLKLSCIKMRLADVELRFSLDFIFSIMLKIGQSHQTGLTANLLKLFEPRPPLEYKPPPEKRKCPPLTGMAQFVGKFAEPGDPEYAPPIQEAETPAQKRARIHKLRLEKGAAKVAEELEKYDSHNDPNISGDPYKTLFVARLGYETTESRIKREFESYGPIKRVRLVTDKNTNKPKGYAFIEYLHTRDMKAAYKQADGRKIEGRRVLVDVERGRTVPNWRPRRLGGGLGTTRVGGLEINTPDWFIEGSNCNQDPLVLKNHKCGRNDRVIGIEKNLVKELGTETENGSGQVNALMTGPVVVTIERINTTEIGRGLGIETEKGREIVDVIEIADMIVIEIVDMIEIVIRSEAGTVTRRGTTIGTENMIPIVKGIEIMMLGTLIGDDHIGSLIMTRIWIINSLAAAMKP